MTRRSPPGVSVFRSSLIMMLFSSPKAPADHKGQLSGRSVCAALVRAVHPSAALAQSVNSGVPVWATELFSSAGGRVRRPFDGTAERS